MMGVFSVVKCIHVAGVSSADDRWSRESHEILEKERSRKIEVLGTFRC